MRAVGAALVLAGVLFGGGCSGDDDELDLAAFDGSYTVTMVVGAAEVDDSAHPAALVEPGDSFTEQWELDCTRSDCTLLRPEGGVVLGDLDGLPLTPATVSIEDGDSYDTLVGEVEGVQAEPDVVEPGPCAGTAAERWTVHVELAEADGVLSGSVIRTPESLLVAAGDTECFGVDLTLGLSGVRR